MKRTVFAFEARDGSIDGGSQITAKTYFNSADDMDEGMTAAMGQMDALIAGE